MTKRRARRRTKRSKFGSLWQPFSDYAGGVIGPGDQLYFKKSDTAIPVDRDFKLVGFHIQAVSEQSSSTQGALGGAVLQINAFNWLGTGVVADFWTTGPLVIGHQPLRRRFKVRGALPISSQAPANVNLLTIQNICQRKDDTGSIRVVVRLDVLMTREEFGRSCPTILTSEPIVKECF